MRSGGLLPHWGPTLSLPFTSAPDKQLTGSVVPLMLPWLAAPQGDAYDFLFNLWPPFFPGSPDENELTLNVSFW